MKKSELQNIIREVLNEENLLIPRRLDGRREIYIKNIRKMLQQKHIKSNLDLQDLADYTEITDLGNVETIGGYLWFGDSPIRSLGNVRTIGGDFNVLRSNIESLGKLQTVGGFLNLALSKITSLGNVRTIGEWLNIAESNINSLGKLESVEVIYYDKHCKIPEELMVEYRKKFKFTLTSKISKN